MSLKIPPPPALLILSSRYNYGVKHNLKQAGKYAVTTVLVLVFYTGSGQHTQGRWKF